MNKKEAGILLIIVIVVFIGGTSALVFCGEPLIAIFLGMLMAALFDYAAFGYMIGLDGVCNFYKYLYMIFKSLLGLGWTAIGITFSIFGFCGYFWLTPDKMLVNIPEFYYFYKGILIVGAAGTFFFVTIYFHQIVCMWRRN